MTWPVSVMSGGGGSNGVPPSLSPPPATSEARLVIKFNGSTIFDLTDDSSQDTVTAWVGDVEARFEAVPGGLGYRRFRFTNHGITPWRANITHGDWFNFDEVSLWLQPGYAPRWTRNSRTEGDGTLSGAADANGRVEWKIVEPTDEAMDHYRGPSATPAQPPTATDQALPGTIGLGLQFGLDTNPLEVPIDTGVTAHFKALGLMDRFSTSGIGNLDATRDLFTGSRNGDHDPNATPGNLGKYLTLPNTFYSGYENPVGLFKHGSAVEADGNKAGTTYRYWLNLLLAERGILNSDAHAFELFLRGARYKAIRMFTWDQVPGPDSSWGDFFEGFAVYERATARDYAGSNKAPSLNHNWLEDIILARAYMPGDPLLDEAYTLLKARLLSLNERIWTRTNSYGAIRSVDRWLHNLLFMYCLEPNSTERATIAARIQWLVGDAITQATGAGHTWFESQNSTVVGAGGNCEAWMNAGTLFRMCQALDLGLLTTAQETDVVTFSIFACEEMIEDFEGTLHGAYWSSCSTTPGATTNIFDAYGYGLVESRPWFIPLLWVVGTNWDFSARWKAKTLVSDLYANGVYGPGDNFGEHEGRTEIKQTGQKFWYGARPDVIRDIDGWSTTPTSGGDQNDRNLGIFPNGYTPGSGITP